MALLHVANRSFSKNIFMSISVAPSAPTAPVLRSPADLTPTSFTLHWDPPTDNGGLAVQNYTVVILSRGSDFCAQTSQETREGIMAGSTSLEVQDGVHAGFQYQFRVAVFTSVFSNTSQNSAIFTTPQAGTAVEHTQGGAAIDHFVCH